MQHPFFRITVFGLSGACAIALVAEAGTDHVATVRDADVATTSTSGDSVLDLPGWTGHYVEIVRGWIDAQAAAHDATAGLLQAFPPAGLGDTPAGALTDALNAEMTHGLDRAVARWRADASAVPTMPTGDWSRLRVEGGRFVLDGRPAFPLGFSWFDEVENADYHVGGATRDVDPTLPSILEQMKPLGIGLHEINARVSSFVTDDPALNRHNAEWLRQRLDLYAAHGMAGNINLIWNHTQPLERRYPGITHSGWHFFRLDIDHPDFRAVAGVALDELFGTIGDHPALAAVSLANEPEFPVTAWSEHTVHAFRDWLTLKYQDAASLNRAWGTGLTSFDEIEPPTHESLSRYPAPRRHDTLTFNRFRATEAFRFLGQRIRRHSPNAALHIKIQDLSSVGVQPHVPEAGIDREAMAEFLDLHGIDTRILPVTDHRGAAPSYDESRYALQWVHGMLAYDHLRTVAPGLALFDSELHAFSTGKLRLEDIAPEHATLAMWLMAAHGSTGNIVWYWQRRDHPDIRHPALSHAFYRSLTTKPDLLAALLEANARLNEHADAIAAIADCERPIQVLFSDSSWLQDHRHMHALHAAYEASAQLGVGVGVCSERMLAEKALPRGTRLLILPAVTHLSAEAAKGLRELAERHGLLVKVGTTDKLTTPSGRALELPVTLDAVSIPLTAAIDDIRRAISESLRDRSKVKFQLVDEDLEPRGVVHRSVIRRDQLLTFAANVGVESCERQVFSMAGRSIWGPVSGTDLLTGDRIEGGVVSFGVRQVRLIRWDDPEPRR